MSLTVQFYTMLCIIGAGTMIGLNFDTYNRFVNRPKRWDIIVFGMDIFFWMVQAGVCFLVLLMVNQGELRFYLLIALLLGYSIYQVAIKNIYLKFLEWVIMIVVKIYRTILYLTNVIVIKPIIMVFTLMMAVLMFLLKLFLNAIKAVLFILWRIIYTSGKIGWWLVPKKIKNYLRKYEGIIKKIKNKCNIIFVKIKDFLIKLKRSE